MRGKMLLLRILCGSIDVLLVMLPVQLLMMGVMAVDATTATAYWGYAASIVTLCVAVLGPILGTLSDFNGYKRPIFFF